MVANLTAGASGPENTIFKDSLNGRGHGRASAPTSRGQTPESDAALIRVCRRCVIAILVVALAWRVTRYALCMPVWGDEASVALNLLDRSLPGLLEPLEHAQVAPFLFLAAEWLMQRLLGASEFSLRLLPLLAGAGAVFLFGSSGY